MMADFWDAMEEAERVRTLTQWGLHELTFALEREELRQGVQHDAPAIPPAAARALQAAWERAEWGRAELENESPHSNAQALISMNSALDAMVEELVKFWRDFQAKKIAEQVTEKAMAAVPEEAAEVTAVVKQVVRDFIEEQVPKALRPKGSGISRYERPLKRIGWQAPEDRPIPEDLNVALTELGALRDVLVHRAGRVDEKALAEAPTLSYKVGQFVRISRDDYRTYSAAVKCYAREVSLRPMRSWPEVTDAQLPDLANWRDYVLVNA